MIAAEISTATHVPRSGPHDPAAITTTAHVSRSGPGGGGTTASGDFS